MKNSLFLFFALWATAIFAFSQEKLDRKAVSEHLQNISVTIKSKESTAAQRDREF